MTDTQKAGITAMRAQNASYSEIAQSLNIPKNTVKSYCNRHGIGKNGGSIGETCDQSQTTLCEYCGAEVRQDLKGKHKRFCSDKCRNRWWAEHPELINRKAVYKHTCQHCGKAFTAYGNERRKYCSHPCYIAARFGGSHDQ